MPDGRDDDGDDDDDDDNDNETHQMITVLKDLTCFGQFH